MVEAKLGQDINLTNIIKIRKNITKLLSCFFLLYNIKQSFTSLLVTLKMLCLRHNGNHIIIIHNIFYSWALRIRCVLLCYSVLYVKLRKAHNIILLVNFERSGHDNREGGKEKIVYLMFTKYELSYLSNSYLLRLKGQTRVN